MRDAFIQPCVTQKNGRARFWGREAREWRVPLFACFSSPGFHEANFFSAISFRATHDGLSERGATRSLAVLDFVLLQKGGTLIVRDLRTEDAGNYICMVSSAGVFDIENRSDVRVEPIASGTGKL